MNKSPYDKAARRALLAFITYTPLSYTWGKAEDKVPIQIDGQKLEVARNLTVALRHMRQYKQVKETASTESFWWVDAICINQEDVPERNSQVRSMTRIFKKYHGHVWLGEEADNSSSALNVVHQLIRPLTAGIGDSIPKFPKVSKEQKMQNCKGLVALFERPWWTRAWIRQEAALLQSITIHC